MKNPDYTAVKASLMIAVVFALAALPLVTYADAHRPSPPTLEDFDSDGDGFVSEDEFVTLRAARMKAHAEAGHTMRGAANAPTFSALDGNGDGVLDPGETAKVQVTLRNAGDAAATSVLDAFEAIATADRAATRPRRSGDPRVTSTPCRHCRCCQGGRGLRGRRTLSALLLSRFSDLLFRSAPARPRNQIGRASCRERV